jgi:DNA-binding MarR family transcriptional regulator
VNNVDNNDVFTAPTRPAAAQKEDAAALATLRLLNAFDTEAGITQRSVAAELGIAVGLVNAYIKRCVRKGYVKTSKAPARRYAYYLTPKGFAEKSRLTAEYLTSSFNFFRNARGQCGDVFGECVASGYRRVVLCGVSDLCEVAFIAATEFEVTLLGVFDPKFERGSFRGLKAVRQFEDLRPVDAAVVTAMPHSQAMADTLLAYLPAERILAPRMLRIGRNPPQTKAR